MNIDKTKVVIFKRSGEVDQNVENLFKYDNQILEIVLGYSYLGVYLSSSVSGLQASDVFISKARIATGTALSIMVNSKSDSWASKMQLFNSTVEFVLMYNVMIWGLSYSNLIQSVQLDFFKRVLMLPKNTPNFTVRLEVRSPLRGIEREDRERWI